MPHDIADYFFCYVVRHCIMQMCSPLRRHLFDSIWMTSTWTASTPARQQQVVALPADLRRARALPLSQSLWKMDWPTPLQGRPQVGAHAACFHCNTKFQPGHGRTVYSCLHCAGPAVLPLKLALCRTGHTVIEAYKLLLQAAIGFVKLQHGIGDKTE